MNEAETRAELIDPMLKQSGWGIVDESRVLREYAITAGRIQTGQRRAKKLIADYVLVYKGIKLAVIEAKRADLDVGEGVTQAKQYAFKLQLETAYSTNGKEIYSICMKTGAEELVSAFPTPEVLWQKTYTDQNEWRNKFSKIPFETRSGTWQPRYYQEIAIKNTLEAIAKEEDRILLTLATGTGKTAIAFQIAWKLFHTRWNLKRDGSRRPRILFLADRNILANQAFNAFNAFPDDAMVRIRPNEIRNQGRVPTNGSIFFTIFQTFMASANSATESRTVTEQSRSTKFMEIAITEPDEVGYMYILECADGSFYTGSTKNLSLRIDEHKKGKASKHTAYRLPVKLIYYETFDRIDNAFNREKQIQKWSRAKKIALIKKDIELLKRLSTNRSSTSSLTESSIIDCVATKVPEPVATKVPEPVATKVPEPVATKVPEPVEGYFGEYPEDYFDLIIIDECHRGGANDESNWRGILDYFSPAVQLGLTATPKRNLNIDTYKYFGEPVYIYSLKEGINDGFLTPFKVKRIQTTMDDYIYTNDDDIIEGEIKEGKLYDEKDFNRIIEIKAREEKRVQVFLYDAIQTDKSIIFCANQAHAALIRDMVNRLSESDNPFYCVRVTANDGERGEQYLREFQDNEKLIPTILTTSQKLSTGVDARNIRNIVLMRPVKQMIEFKQIIGRGTRLFDGKEFFTIYDFVDAYHRFFDPEWDGEPIPELCKKCKQIPCICEKEEPKPCDVCKELPCVCPPEPRKPCEKCGQKPCVCIRKVKIKLKDGKEREIQHMTQTSFWNADGKPISAEEFLHNLFGVLPEFFKSEDELRAIWSNPITRRTLLENLETAGFGKDELNNLKKLINAEKSDLYDVLEYVLNSNVKPISRKERVALTQTTIFAMLDDKQKEFIDFVLNKYIESGVGELDREKLPILLENKYQSLEDAKEILGNVQQINALFIEFQKYLYQKEVA
jgi:superfamily II DNA or RNA helicase/predicted GIY-YIG superfamily endonuclease